jgi:hypothetical protein
VFGPHERVARRIIIACKAAGKVRAAAGAAAATAVGDSAPAGACRLMAARARYTAVNNSPAGIEQ